MSADKCIWTVDYLGTAWAACTGPYGYSMDVDDILNRHWGGARRWHYCPLCGKPLELVPYKESGRV